MWTYRPKSFCICLTNNTIELRFDKEHNQVEFYIKGVIVGRCDLTTLIEQTEQLLEYLKKYYVSE